MRLLVPIITCLLLVVPAAAVAAPQAPGAPGGLPTFAPADKHGFGTAYTTRSTVWFTLRSRELSEVYYPDLGTPALRGLELVVSDGRRVERETREASGTVARAGRRSLTYSQTTRGRSGSWRAIKTVVTDPRRATVLVDIRLESLTGRRLTAWVVVDPQLSNNGRDDRARTRGGALVARDGGAASALVARGGFRATSSGYVGTRSDPRRDLRDGRLDRRWRAGRRGNVVQVGEVRGGRVQLALGFGPGPRRALAAARGSLRRPFAAVAADYAAGWERYLDGLAPAPASVGGDPRLYETSLMVMAALEDKRNRGASVASPSMPWAWGQQTVEKPLTGPYHLVWSRDLYQVATAAVAAGDVAQAQRLLDFLLFRQQKRDGSFPQNSQVDGREKWTNTQMDEVALPLVLAWQLGRDDARTWRRLKRAADYVLRVGPKTKQERWENQEGYSPGTIAAEIAGLVCAADLARRNGDPASAARYEAAADRWEQRVRAWTATSNGPYAPRPYYLRITKDKQPDEGTRYAIGDSGPGRADQRSVVDPSFLELVRLGVKAWDDPVILNSVAVVDQKLKVDTPNGTFWRRFSFDGYGETRRGGLWDIGEDDTFKTLGRAWPIFAGERGEYDLLAGRPAAAHLAAMAGAANDGQMIPEQVWDGRPPTGTRGYAAGENTFSATPLAWSHAQYVRLAWSLDAGRPVEQPAIVACRYTGRCG